MESKRTFLSAFATSSLLIVAIAAGCSKNEGTSSPDRRDGITQAPEAAPVPAQGPAKFIRSDYAPGEVTALCEAAQVAVEKRIQAIMALPAEQRTKANVLIEFENAMADFSDETGPLTFMGSVSTDAAINKEGSACEEKLGQYYVDLYSRRPLYNALASIQSATDLSADETRLLTKTVEGFEQSGMKLPDDQLAQVKALQAELSSKEAKFSTNLNSDVSTVAFTEAELKGVPAEFIQGLKRDANGKRIVTTKSTDYVTVMENSVTSATRRKMQEAYLNRGVAAGNVQLLEEAVVLRSRIAKVLGYETWADYKLTTRMAKNRKNVEDFLTSLRGKLAERNAKDLAQLLAFKKELEPTATKVDQWDIAYLGYQLRKRDFTLDNEEIREYFPSDVVIAGMFDTYSRMLGVTYKEVVNANVWAPGVKLYEIHDKTDDRLIAYFYADFFPRELKYGHAAAFTLISGRRMPNGAYSLPISSIVANFTPPTADKPSLLLHDEVETIFHEFGHIMHQTLTRAPFASLSGSGTARDFVEAPSQMLENWVWSPAVLASLSGHYLDHSRKLPPELLGRMIQAKDFQQGFAYTKQLLYGTFDMTLHTTRDGAPVDSTKTYDDLYRELMGHEPLPGGHFGASFGHLMGGYDAGYYGYLWSEVYAQDMFSIFPADDLTSPEIGGRYRRAVLEQGNMKDAIELLRDFLGREPSNEAFFKKLGIQ